MKNEIKYNGPSGMFIMFLIFMTLKLTNFITWSWWWVTAPLWAPVAFVLIILIFIVAGLLVKEAIKQIKK